MNIEQKEAFEIVIDFLRQIEAGNEMFEWDNKEIRGTIKTLEIIFQINTTGGGK